MKNIKRKISMLLILAMIFSIMIPSTSLAATTTLTATTTSQSQKLTSRSTWYKISFPGEGYLTLTCSKSPETSVGIYDSDKELLTWADYSNPLKIAVSKGYIYVKADYLESGSKFTYKFTSITQKTNYCKANAYNLVSDKKVNFYQTPNYNFRRWIKIKTTTTQRITIYTKTSDFYDVSPRLYSSKGKSIDLSGGSLNSSNYHVHKTVSLGPGTYYLTFGDKDFDGIYSITTVYWK